MTVKYKGACACGAIEFNLEGEPLFTQHCHCNKCREIAALSRRPSDKLGYGHTAAYLTSMLTITKGDDQLQVVSRGSSDLYLCQHCQSLIYGISQDPDKQAGIGVNVSNIDFSQNGFPETFKADKHIWYQERVQAVDDDLPKYKDAPIEQFGSGELMT